MDVEHVDFVGVHIFDFHMSIGAAQVTAKRQGTVSAGGAVIAIDGGRGGSKRTRDNRRGVLFLAALLLGAKPGFKNGADFATARWVKVNAADRCSVLGNRRCREKDEGDCERTHGELQIESELKSRAAPLHFGKR